MKIALAQMSITDNIRDNLEKTVDNIRLAANQGAELVFFPELQLTPFFPNKSGNNAELYLMDVDGEEITTIRNACREYKISASPNIYLRGKNGKYDANIMIDNRGEIVGISKMVHVSSFPNFYEAEYYTPSDGGFNVYDLPVNGGFCRVGVVICYDRHFPESIRCCALKNADLVIIPTANMVGEPDEMFLWELRIQAMHNSVFIAMCNRTGCGFSGRSAVIDCGVSVISYSGAEEQLIIADIDPAKAASVRKALPYFASRRPDRYSPITEDDK